MAMPKIMLVPKIKMSLTEVLDQAAACRTNVGCPVEFIDHLTGAISNGVIKSVWVDKRVPLALYHIDVAGIRRNKVVTSLEMNILPKPVNEPVATATEEPVVEAAGTPATEKAKKVKK